MRTFSRYAFIGFFLLVATQAFGQLDDGNRNLLIDKLDKVYQNLAPSDSSKVAVTLRLADLYAERARVSANKELEGNCTDCKAGAGDRKKALKLYTEVLDRAPESVQGKVMVQVGHLYQMTGDENKALSFYQRILNEKSAPELKAEAQLSVAEIYFKRRDYAKAQGYYREVMKNPAASSRGLAAYRDAWSSFNLGNVKAAVAQMEEILKTPALLSRNGSGGAQVDPQFQDEVSRDYATFLAKKGFDKKDIDSLYALSPENAKIENVKGLALEAERTGKKAEALQAWKFVYGYMNKPEDRLAAKISMAQMYFDTNDRKNAAENFESGMELWKDLKSCQSSQCDELRRRSRQFVITWNQVEKKNPSAELVAAYASYLQNFPDDIDMHTYRAQAARELKNWKAAWESYDRARELQLASKTNDKLESTLVTMLDIAEESKDEKLITKAYDNYLEQSPKETKAFEVRYQKAHRLYEAGNYAVASEELRALALDKSGPAKVRKQAADLSLDSLVLMKDESKMTAWAKEYAGLFTEGASDFTQIVQKSVLTKSANLAGSDAAAAYAEMAEFNPAQATEADRIKFYKNKLILAEKLNKFSEAQAAADALLKQASLSAEDREFAWARKAYMSEMTLDFASALTATDKLQKSMKPDEKILKMAMFAELSGQKSATGYYGQYLNSSRDEESKKLVAAELVRKSKAPEKELEHYRPIFAKSPGLMAQLYTEAFAKTSNDQILKKVSKDPALKSTDSGKLLTRIAFLKDFAEFKKKISAHRLETKSDRQLASSIKARAALLDKLEGFTQQAISSADFTAQLVSLDLLAKESERFYNELLSAPMPKGLSDEEQQQYMSMLSAQATPFQAKSLAAKAKVEEFWKNPSMMTALKASWEQVDLRNLILVEVNALREIAPENVKTDLAQFTAEATQKNQVARPSLQEIQTARTSVLKNPFDKEALQALQALEKKSENTAMSQYLQTRIDGLGAKNSTATKETL